MNHFKQFMDRDTTTVLLASVAGNSLLQFFDVTTHIVLVTLTVIFMAYKIRNVRNNKKTKTKEDEDEE